jgi:putative endopeptidase
MRKGIWLALVLALTGQVSRSNDKPGKAGIEKAYVVPEVRPQDDLFRHVNGKWLAEAQIPPDRSIDGAFHKLRDKSEADLRAIIEAAAKADAPAGSEARKVGDLYTTFLDETEADRKGISPIRADLALVDAIADRPTFLHTMARLQREGVDGLFELNVDTDAKRSDRYVVYLGQGGIGLPDESYYRDPKFKAVRDAYVAHIRKTLELAGIPDATAKADRIKALETRIAKEHWDRVKSRDDTLTYNKFDRIGLATLAHGIDWTLWFDSIGAKQRVDVVIVRQPSYFTAMSGAIGDVPLEDWKAWLTWHVIESASPFLSKPFVDEHFAFSGKILTGAPENRPRWKRGVALVERALGEAVGKLYVEKHFPAAAKDRMKVLVGNLIEAYRRDIQTLDWMSPATKAKALDKLSKFTPKIGYPDRWRDYSRLEIRPGDLVGNVRRATAFELDRQLAKLSKPVDKLEWQMTPQTVNAYYNPGMNEIVFPAAILQPPFFDLEADDAVNYGGIGAVIGHEIGHGFDDQGSKYDGNGNMNDWWTDADRREFDKRAKMLIEQYNGFSPAQLPTQHVNGALTIGENIGDLGGLTIGYKAYTIALEGTEPPVLDGLTGPQRFFFGWAQVWRTKARDAEVMRRLATDPHSPAEFRCNGVIRNLTEFYEAFGVKQGDKLWLPPEKRVRIW